MEIRVRAEDDARVAQRFLGGRERRDAMRGGYNKGGNHVFLRREFSS